MTYPEQDAILVTPAPYLAGRIPGAVLPQMIYNSGGQFWWHAAQAIAHAGQTRLAAEVIGWARHAHPHKPSTHDATSLLATAVGPSTWWHPPAGSGGEQEC